jgi:hypothetical protein
VKVARPARMFHRGGRLRFTFEKLEVPDDRKLATSSGIASTPVHAQLAATEPSAGAVEVNSEGEVKTTESKARFLGPVLAGIAAAQSGDEKEHGSATQEGNRGGVALGGFSGLGLLGSALAQSSQTVGQALGYWGLGVSIYTNVISRGQEVIFGKNHSIDVLFNPRRPAAAAAHLLGGTD